MKYAGFRFRGIAAIVDGIVTQIATIVIVSFTVGVSMDETAITPAMEVVLILITGVLVHWLYFTVSESSTWQATVGKRVFGLKVTDMENGKIGFGKANGRYWSKIISVIILFIGFIMVAFTKRNQGLHDIIAGTLVVREA